MKKFLTLLTAMLLVVVAVFSVACNNSSLVGTYKFKAMYVDVNNGCSIYEEGDSYDGYVLSKENFILKLYDNNTLEISYAEGNITTKQDGVWYQSSDYTIDARVEYDEIRGYVNGNKIIVQYGYYGPYYILEKQ